MTSGDPLNDLQARGVAAASEIFDRIGAQLGARADHNGASDPHSNGAIPADDPIGQQQLRAAAARTIDLFAGLFQQTLELFIELADGIVGPNSEGAAVLRGSASGIALAGIAGETAGATVWIHNATAEPAAGIVLRITDLTAHTGERVEVPSTLFVPRALDVAPGESSSSMLALAIPAHAAAGVYHGHVLATGLPSAALSVRLVVAQAP